MLLATALKLDVYKPRQPRKSDYYRLVESHYEELEQAWEDNYQSKYGFWRPYVMNVIYKYLDCGDPHFGFARVKCEDCGSEYILPFSCKRRHFCPSCHQKRVVEFGEHLHEEVLKEVSHRQWAGRKQACCSPKHPGYLAYQKDYVPTLCMTANFYPSSVCVRGRFCLYT